MKTEVITSMEYHELEDLVKATYGIKDYEFVAVEECGNDSTHRFDIKEKKILDPENPLDKCDLEKLEQIKADKVPTYSNYVILQDLVNRGVLAPAVFLIEVSW